MRRLDHETPTIDAAAHYEHDTSDPDWDQALNAEDACRDSFPQPPIATESSTRPRLPEWDDLW